MKRNLRHPILYVLIIVLMLINSSCKPDRNYPPESDFQEDTIQDEPEPQEQSVATEPLVIFDNINTNRHSSFPPIPPTFTLKESWHITSILVMHWNHAEGVEPGEITILDDQDNVYGTWQAEGLAPEPQYPNTYWVVRPDRVLEPGTYIIYDSDPETQSYNAESGNMGMVRVEGFPDSGYLNTEGIDGIVPIDSGNPVRSITFTEKELSAEGETKDVSPESPKATAAGVTVDFGEFNLAERGTLEVAKLPDKEDESTGVQVQAYNITLGDINEFPVMVEVTMPYDPDGLTNEEEPNAISVGWYDASQNTWEFMPCTVNNADNTVTFQTDHLSPFAVIKNEMNKGEAVFYYAYNLYFGPNTPVVVDPGALNQTLNKIDPSSFDELIRNKSVPTNEFFSTGLGLVNDSLSGLDYLKDLGSSTLQNTIGKKFIVLGAVAVAVKIADQWSRGVIGDKIIRDNAFDLAELALTGVLIVTGSPYVMVAVGGIWIAGIVDDIVNDEVDIKTYMDGVERSYDYFNRDHITYFAESGTCSYRFPMPGVSDNLRLGERKLEFKSDWGRVVSGIYKEDKEYPNLIKKDVNALITSYCDTFWNMNYGNRNYWVENKHIRNKNNDWVKLIPEGKIAKDYLPWPENEVDRQVYKDRCIIREHNRLQPLYKLLADKALTDLWTEYYTAAFQLADQLNQTMYFDVEDPALTEPGFAKSSSANKVLALATDDGKVSDDFYCNERYKDSNQVFSCTMYHYINAGMPSKLMIWPDDETYNWDDYSIGESVPFSADMPRTIIQLPGNTETLFRFKDDIVYIELYETIDIMIYYRDAPPGATIATDTGEEGAPYRFKEGALYGHPAEGGWWVSYMSAWYDFEGQYTFTARMYTKDGALVAEDSVLVVVNPGYEGEYRIDGRVPSGD